MPQRRRSRFTVVLAGQDAHVILAYSSDDVRRHYESIGYTVVRVTRGDFRKPTAPAATGPRFRVNDAALREAIDLFGLRLPVRVRLHARCGITNGSYRFEGTYHNIMLKSYRTAQEASETLWHELTHALQAERAGSVIEWDRVYAEQRRYPYRVRPVKIEAREMSATMADIPLTVAI